jgi:hypothetical protein
MRKKHKKRGSERESPRKINIAQKRGRNKDNLKKRNATRVRT